MSIFICVVFQKAVGVDKYTVKLRKSRDSTAVLYVTTHFETDFEMLCSCLAYTDPLRN